MSARPPRILCALVAAATVLAGCGQSGAMIVTPAPTLAPPTPDGMQEMPPQPPLPPDKTADDCNPTASLRPFSDPADADAAVAGIRARGRLIVGLDIGSNLFSFRDPISGEIVGFDVDVAGEVARDIFGNPSQVEYRILSSDERITALEKGEVDIVVKTMTINCDRRKDVNFSTVYLDAAQRILAPRDSPITKPADLSGKRVCVAKGTTSDP
jgi:polar amino acid transport system substrate-binding protein